MKPVKAIVSGQAAAANSVVLAILLGTALSSCARSAGRDDPGILVSPDMAYTVPYDPYDPNPMTANGATLMLPPEGAVPVDGVYFPYGPGREEAARAGAEVNNPLEANKVNLKRGKHIFDTYCAVCHGSEGNGDGPIIGRFPNPPSLHGERAKTIADGEMYHIISKGQGLMASYAAQILPDDRWRAVHYIRRLQVAK